MKTNYFFQRQRKTIPTGDFTFICVINVCQGDLEEKDTDKTWRQDVISLSSLQPPTKIVGKVEDDHLDFDYISKDLIYRYVLCIDGPPSTPYQC